MRTNKIDEVMSTLKDLCKVIPAEVLRQQTQYNVAKRAAASYAKRLATLSAKGEGAFDVCKERRPRPKKVQVRHENSSCGSIITVKRFNNSRITCVCKTRL